MTRGCCLSVRILGALFFGMLCLPLFGVVRERIVVQPGEAETHVQLQDLLPEKKYELGVFEAGKATLLQSHPVNAENGESTVNVTIRLPKTGMYQLRLKVDGGWQQIEDLPPAAIPKEGFRLTRAEIDRRERKITLVLPVSCIFRVVATNESQMNILTLRSWRFGAAGQKVDVPWDFWDGEKVKNYFDDPSLAILADYIPLPEGFLVEGNPDFTAYRDIAQFKALQLPAQDFKFTISLRTGDPEKDPAPEQREGIPVMRAGDIVKVVVSEASLKELSGRRFEILYFVEGDFVHEETEGMSPSNYSLPDLGRPPGRCHLTVNIRDFEGNAGSSTVLFWYQPSDLQNPSH